MISRSSPGLGDGYAVQDATAEEADQRRGAHDKSLSPDPRWGAVEKIVASRHFAKAPLLSRFLLFVCEHVLQLGQTRLTEHQIGVAVFGRRAGYDLSEDNIVRNYARQLRKRLAEYYQSDGQADLLVVDIPRGGYLPTFTARLLAAPRQEAPEIPGLQAVIPPPAAAPATRSRVLWLLVYSLALCAASVITVLAIQASRNAARSSDILWRQIFTKDSDTFVVPSDSSASLYQNISKQSLSLADFLNGGYRSSPVSNDNKALAAALRGQRDTTVTDLEIATEIARLPEVVGPRLLMRYSRDLRMDDLKKANAVLIGSRYSNPWAEIFERNLNFRFEYRPEIGDSWIRNEHPLTGESAGYLNGWDQPSHRTYAVLALVPNLNETGHVLLIEGLDVAGTQAAAELLFKPAEMAPILARARRSDGALNPFEVLLQTTSIGASAPSALVIAWRVHSSS